MRSKSSKFIQLTKKGLYCEKGDFYLDPVSRFKVQNAIISHGHADHLRAGHNKYFCTTFSVPILSKRISSAHVELDIDAYDYGQEFYFNDVKVSFHPAGHILGSAQVRMEYQNKVWLYTGDFKRGADPTCLPFEIVQCDYLISEATFPLPIFRWPRFSDEVKDIYQWWQENKRLDRPSLLGAYSLGKAQRIMKALRAYTDEEILVHGAVDEICKAYAQVGVDVGPYHRITQETKDFKGRLIIAPPAATRSAWSAKMKNKSTAFASGWMRIRGNRRRRGVDRGFIISDHADWNELVQTFKDCEAKKIYLFHHNSIPMQNHLSQMGFDITTTEELRA